MFVDPRRAMRTSVRPITADQVRRLLNATNDDRLGPLFLVGITSGLRQGELLALRRENVDLTAATLTVRYALQRIDKTPVLVEPTTKKSRRAITQPASAVTALVVQKDRQTFARQLASDRWQEWGSVFASSIGTPLNPSNVTHQFQELLAAAGLPRQRFHALRHCSASLLLAQGIPARTIMERHSQISLTINTYAHLSPALEREAARALDSLLASGE
jgi:integrase